MNAPLKTDKTHRQRVLETITELCESGQFANRTSVVRLSGLKRTSVDDSIKDLKELNLIRCDVPGFYEPVDQTVDRPLSITSQAFGRHKLEIGDHLIVFTPREAVKIAEYFAGLLFSVRMFSQPTAAPAPSASSEQPKFSVSKSAMIHLHQHQWPTIEGDMANATSNGLVRAKTGSRGWDEAAALAWARANKKIRNL